MAESASDPPAPTTPWEDEFRLQRPRYVQLAEEAEFALGRALDKAGVRVHTLRPRAKTLESLREKAMRKGYDDPIAQAEDLAGVRIVVLFRSDLPRVRDVVHELYEPLSEEDTIDGGDPSSFGYMSIHYIVQLKDEHAGPRYDELKGLKLEIQVRTIVTDAWNAISRYLDYKGESSIPSPLKRDFFALSGLFYVADKHFELFFLRSEASREAAEAAVSAHDVDADVELNLDTLMAYLRDRYPDRRNLGRESVSELVEDIVPFGFTTIRALDTYLDEHESEALPRAEDESRQDLLRAQMIADESWSLADVGAVRVVLRKAMPAFDEALHRKMSEASDD